MRVLGVDPDLHSCAIVVASFSPGEAPYVESAGIASVSSKLKGLEASSKMAEVLASYFDKLARQVQWDLWIVEAQQVYPGKAFRAADLIALAVVSGAAVASSQAAMPSCAGRGRLVLPSEWKGQVPKQVHQARILRRAGMEFEAANGYCVPSLPWGQGLKKASYKHLVDAFGLCLFGSTELRP